MITGITIENFKGIRDRVTLDFRPITLLFGANSGGKSTILHALHYAREVFERQNLDADRTIAGGPFVDLGGYRNFRHQHMSRTDSRLGASTDWGDGRPNDGGRGGNGENLGERFEERVGFGGRSQAPNTYREIRLAITIALSEFELPEYQSSEDGGLGDQFESLYSGIHEATVTVSIVWSDHHRAPHINEYSVSYNGSVFATVTSQPGRRAPVLESVDLGHPILVKRSEMEQVTLWESLTQEECEGDEHSALYDMLNRLHRNAWMPKRKDDTAIMIETLSDQRDALPGWGKRLPLNAWCDAWGSDKSIDPAEEEELHSYNREINNLLSRLIVGPGELIRNALREFRYLGPLRETPPRDFTPPRFPDPARWATGLGAWDALQSGSDQFVDRVGDWLSNPENLNSGCRVERHTYMELDCGDPVVRALLAQRAFDDIDEHPGTRLVLAPTSSRVVIVPNNTNIELRPHDVGIGISQVVPVIVTALDGSERLLAIEQPELHIHPRLQAEIADLFIEAIHKNKHRFIIETHSEHLILRLLRRIRETEVNKAPADRTLRTDELAIYYLKQEDGATRALEIEVDVKGEFIQPWPDDFFEIDFYERFKTGEDG